VLIRLKVRPEAFPTGSPMPVWRFFLQHQGKPSEGTGNIVSFDEASVSQQVRNRIWKNEIELIRTQGEIL
jgi:hypothetical protein